MIEIPWSHYTFIYFTALPLISYVEGLGFILLFGFYPPVMLEIIVAEYIKAKTGCALNLYGNSDSSLLSLQTSGGIIQNPTHVAKGL